MLGFQYRSEAQRFLAELRSRLEQYGLELHRGKTRLIKFGRFAASDRAKRGEGRPETFEFLGFTHSCERRRSDGGFAVLRETIGRRLRQKAKEVRVMLMHRRHEPVAEQGRWLRSVVRGFFNYHAVPGNLRALKAFRTLVSRAWLHALLGRSQKGRKLNWKRMQRLIAMDSRSEGSASISQ